MGLGVLGSGGGTRPCWHDVVDDEAAYLSLNPVHSPEPLEDGEDHRQQRDQGQEGVVGVSEIEIKQQPDQQGGKQRGFKLFSIKPKSVFSKIGLKNGDVLQTVNGYTLSSPDKILEVYGKLKDSEQISIDVLRRGKARSFEYSIR